MTNFVTFYKLGMEVNAKDGVAYYNIIAEYSGHCTKLLYRLQASNILAMIIRTLEEMVTENGCFNPRVSKAVH